MKASWLSNYETSRFVSARSRGGKAPVSAVREAAIEPQGSAHIPSGSRGHGDSLLRQAGQAKAGDVEFENFWCHKVNDLAKAGDGQFGLDGKHSTEFGARLVEMAEMRKRDDFDPHLRDVARLVVQGPVGPFDRLFEAPRNEMSE